MTASARNIRICMDERMLVASGGTGVATYARALRLAQRRLSADAMLLRAGAPKLAARTARLRRVALSFAPWSHQLVESGDSLALPDLFRLAHLHFKHRRRLLTVRAPGPPGIMHWTYPFPIRIAGWANLYTVHDVIPLLHPPLTSIDESRHRRLLARIVEAAAGLVTVSEAARAEIVAALGCPAAFVANCGIGLPPLDQLPDAGGLPAGVSPGRYLLACGSVEPRKNIARLLEAYRTSGVALPLVIAGPDGWRAETLTAAIAATPGVIRLPYRTASEIAALIAHARALVMPSLAEGFGLPVAEAMALGTPVLTSHDGALAETAGDAALSVDPLDSGALAAGLRRIAHDDTLRAKLAKAGPRNAARFDQSAFATRIEALYATVP